MTDEMQPPTPSSANRLRWTTKDRTLYRLRIEDAAGNPLTPFEECSKGQAQSIGSGPFFSPAFTQEGLPAREEDYRLPITSNEDLLRARLNEID